MGGAYPNVETLVTVAGRSAKGENLRARVSNTDLEVTVSVFLLEDETDCLFYINEEATRRGALLVVGHPPGTQMPIIFECGEAFGGVAIRARL